MADRLEVNVSGLEDLATRLQRICTTLDDTRSFFSGYEYALGDDDVIGAANHFESHWKDGRKHVKNNASTLSSMAAESAQAYRQADQQLADSLVKASESASSHSASGGE